MNAKTALALLQALISGIQNIWPVIEDLVKKGEITVEEQQALHDKYKELMASGAGQFSKDHWKIQ